MTFKNKLEELATANGWGFEYARRDFQNLRDFENMKADSVEGYSNDETILFCDPMRISDVPNDLKQSIGTFMILTRSNLDRSYNDRFTLFIEPLIAELESIKSKVKCDWDIVRWETTEVINVFDLNADGILINFTMQGYE